MTSEEHERMLALCQQVGIEKDPGRFNSLIRELNDLLERKQQRIEPQAYNPDLRGGFEQSTKASWMPNGWDATQLLWS